MGLFEFYSHLFKPVMHRRELLLLLMDTALPNMLLLPFICNLGLFVIILVAWGMLVATLYCLYKVKKHNN